MIRINLSTEGGFPQIIMVWQQTELSFPPRRRGLHCITHEIATALASFPPVKVGLLHLFLLHTSASLTINENADPDVLSDLELALNHVAPEKLAYSHTIEGPDDMPAHVKSSLLGCSLTIPVQNGCLRLGTWQGIYLCEHRNRATARQIVLTLQGEESVA